MTLRALFRALRLLATPGAAERDIDDEIAAHLELQTRHHVQDGMAPGDARLAAEMEFGPAVVTKQHLLSLHATPGAGWPDALAGDLRFALRSIRRHRAFSAVTLTVLTLGIAAATTMFSVVSGVLLRPLPFRHPEQMLMIWAQYPDPTQLGVSQPMNGRQVTLLREHPGVFAHVTGMVARQLNLGSGAAPVRVDGVGVDDDFFETMGVTPAIGRAFRPGEEHPGSDHVVVLSWSLWRRTFAGDPTVVGRPVLLNGEAYTVVGIGPRGFSFPHGAEMPTTLPMPATTDLWVPVAPATRGPSESAVVARVRPGVTVAQAQATLDAAARALEVQIPQGKGYFDTRAVPLQEQLVGDVRRMLVILLAAVAVLLLIACVNVAQLFLARLQGRQSELAVRAALGASTSRLARLLLLESIVLTAVAGVLGTVLGAAAIAVVRGLAPERLPQLASVRFDSRVILASLGITVICAMLFGLVPALATSRLRLAAVLRRSGRQHRAGGSSRARRTLIVAEIALSLVLVMGSGLLIRSLARQLGGDLGFSAPHGLTFEVSLPSTAYPERQQATSMDHPAAVAFINTTLERLRALPGVKAAAVGKPLPMSGAEEATAYQPENADPRVTADHRVPIIEFTVASPEMFTALGTPLREGRDFNAADLRDSPPVIIINQAAAHYLWPGQDPIGKRIHVGGPATPAPWMTVVGVAADMRRYSLTRDPGPEMYVPFTQQPYPSFSTMQFVVRGTLPASQLAGPIQRTIASVDPAIPVARFRTIDELVHDQSASARFAATAMTAFGIGALVLAMIGLYGVMAYAVNQRRQEFGVRTALGAGRGNILRLVLGDALSLTAIGLVLGVLLALAAGRVLTSVLYQVSAMDPLSLAGSVAVLIMTSMVACLLPAIRAARIDPRVALDDR
jgi:putative ABC transport system permease protein